MKPFIRLACLALCAGLLLAASACSQQDSSQASTVPKFCGKRSHAYAGAHRSSHSGTFHTHPGAHAFARAGELPGRGGL